MASKGLLPAVLLLSLAGGVLDATLVERLSLDQIVDRSERIVHGRCTRTWAEWDANRQFIWTHSELQVLDPLKGGSAASVIVSEPGGIVGDEAMLIEGVPRYESGEEVVVFLFRTPLGQWRARGLGQGKYRVTAEPGGARRVTPDLRGLALVEANRRLDSALDSQQMDGASLGQFKTRIRALVAK